jgi:putative CocE/NonD family hydrolase
VPKLALCALIAGLAVSFVAAPAAEAVVRETGYFEARDGTELRYSVERPDGPGPFPVLVNYEGYAAGTNPRDNGVSTYADRLLERGYAIVGVSVRGTGCSEGVFDPFARTMGTDGADAVEWAAAQPWSDGRVGMIGVSFGGITQLLTAAEQPPHLKAIAPSSALSDLYRDVAYPGGILEYDFVFAWTVIQKQGGATYAAGNAASDPQCAQNFASHQAAGAHPDFFIPTVVTRNPFFDDFNGEWANRSPVRGFPDIEVPAYLLNAWQDEQLPARIFGELDRFGRPGLVWMDVTNGNHGRDYYASYAQDRTLDFLDRFVRGVDNGFEERVPHLTLAMETRTQHEGSSNVPTWMIERGSVLTDPKPRSLYLRSDGRLDNKKPKSAEPGDSYAYPLQSPDLTEPGTGTGTATYKLPVVPGGYTAYTSDPLERDLVVAGPGSLDLWMSSTATDSDVQVTVTEVRPDGQETYVQRGWLRASHRKLDNARSTKLRPYHTHLRADADPLTQLEPTFMRVEIFPFAHAFRAGSRLRVWIDAPTSHTGFWAFAPHPEPAVNTVLHDPEHPSRLVLGELPRERAQAPLPACDTLRNQPCRPDPLAQ